MSENNAPSTTVAIDLSKLEALADALRDYSGSRPDESAPTAAAMKEFAEGWAEAFNAGLAKLGAAT
jgi:hypothetical protein